MTKTRTKKTTKNDIAAHVLGYLDASDEPGLDGCLDHVVSDLGRQLTKQEESWLVEVFEQEVRS
jgi:hypothetical protein